MKRRGACGQLETAPAGYRPVPARSPPSAVLRLAVDFLSRAVGQLGTPCGAAHPRTPAAASEIPPEGDSAAPVADEPGGAHPSRGAAPTTQEPR